MARSGSGALTTSTERAGRLASMLAEPGSRSSTTSRVRRRRQSKRRSRARRRGTRRRRLACRPGRDEADRPPMVRRGIAVARGPAAWRLSTRGGRDGGPAIGERDDGWAGGGWPLRALRKGRARRLGIVGGVSKYGSPTASALFCKLRSEVTTMTCPPGLSLCSRSAAARIRSSGTAGSSQSRTARTSTSRASARTVMFLVRLTPFERFPRSRRPFNRRITACACLRSSSVRPRSFRSSSSLSTVGSRWTTNVPVGAVRAYDARSGLRISEFVSGTSRSIGSPDAAAMSRSSSNAASFLRRSSFRLFDGSRDGVIPGVRSCSPPPHEIVGRVDLGVDLGRRVRKSSRKRSNHEPYRAIRCIWMAEVAASLAVQPQSAAPTKKTPLSGVFGLTFRISERSSRLSKLQADLDQLVAELFEIRPGRLADDAILT